MARGGPQGGLNCLTHAIPRRLPTPTEEADGNGYGVIAGRRGPSRPPPRASVNLVPLLLTGVSLHPPWRTDKNLCRCFGAPVRRVLPDHLITYLLTHYWRLLVRASHSSCSKLGRQRGAQPLSVGCSPAWAWTGCSSRISSTYHPSPTAGVPKRRARRPACLWPRTTPRPALSASTRRCFVRGGRSC